MRERTDPRVYDGQTPWDAVRRWAASGFALPQHHFLEEVGIRDTDCQWRLCTTVELELQFGFEKNHSITAGGSGKAKTKDAHRVRQNLLAQSLHPHCFGWLLNVWCLEHHLLPQMHFPCAWPCERDFDVTTLRPSTRGLTLEEELVFQIFRGMSHRGSEVRVATGEILRPLQWPRRPVNVEYWRWRNVIKIHWKWKAHINELEARGALAALKWRTRSRAGLGQRWLHLVDSFIVIAVMSRKRSTSKILNRVIKKFAILELASFTQCVFAFTRSHENPSDAPSRDTG